MKIAAHSTRHFEPRFKGAGFVSAMGVQTVLRGRLLQITLASGLQSTGEIVHWPGNDWRTVQTLEDRALSDLAGRNLSDVPQCVQDWRQRDPRLAGLALALDTVFHDIVGRCANVPISALLGGPAVGLVPEVLSLSSDTPDGLADTLRARGHGYTTIQIKLTGTDETQSSLAVIEAALAALRPGQIILADFNGALTIDVAQRLLPGIRDPRLIWEDPCIELDENRALAASLDHPILFDQCLKTPACYRKVLEDGAAAGVVIKPARLGGLYIARSVRDLCAASGMRMRVDGPWCGQIGAAAVLHLAIGVPRALMLGSIDLTEALETSDDLVARPRHARIGPAPGPGLGRSHSARNACSEDAT